MMNHDVTNFPFHHLMNFKLETRLLNVSFHFSANVFPKNESFVFVCVEREKNDFRCLSKYSTHSLARMDGPLKTTQNGPEHFSSTTRWQLTMSNESTNK